MINTLPQSLIDTADQLLRSRLLSHSGTKILNDIWSIHHECDPYFIHPILQSLNEHTDEFHSWINATEDTPTKLHIKSYLQLGISTDNEQMNHRLITVPMSHPELFHETHAKMTDHHKSIVRSYSEIGLRHNQYPSGSYRINKFLIDASDARMPPNPQIRHHPYGDIFDIRHMDDAIQSHHLPHKLTTYSGIGFNPEHIIDKDGYFNSPAYMSSSTRRFVSAKYAIQHDDTSHHILQINHNVGNTGIYVGNRTHLTQFSDDEFILPRQSILKVDSDPMIYHISGHTFHVWNTHRHTNIYNGGQ
jgi:hypothetical protein